MRASIPRGAARGTNGPVICCRRSIGRGVVLYLTHSPGPPLSEFIDCFWLLAGAQTSRKEWILPSGTIELVVNLRENEMRIHDPAQPGRYKRFSGAILSGTYSRVFVCDAIQHESILGVDSSISRT